jgi:hypothetical protein
MSATKHYTLAKQTFRGSRFDDHGLDLDVLPEILSLRTLIAEVAKDVWRMKNPERERLAVNFGERFTLKIFSLHEGSTTVPLERIYKENSDDLLAEPPEDEFDEAVDLIADSITAVQNEKTLPKGLSRRVLPMFARLTGFLLPDESFWFTSGRSNKVVLFSQDTKALFERRIAADFEDEITIKGELRAANLDSQTFTLRLSEEFKVPGKFSEDQEATITEALRDHKHSRLEIKGVGVFAGATGELLRMEKVNEFRSLTAGGASSTVAGKSIWEMAEEIGAAIPEEEWDKLPQDASTNFDYYLYRPSRRDE